MARARRASRDGSAWSRLRKRGPLAALAALIGIASLSPTLANVVVGRDPLLAHGLAPWDGTITASAADELFSQAPTGQPGAEPVRLAQLALEQDPTAVEALSVLGLHAQLRNDTRSARNAFSYSLALSRRELPARIWAIEEAVNRGDIGGALEQYDIALRTSRSAPDLLFPVLASAIGEPRVRSELIEDLARGPAWAPAFMQYVTSSGLDPASAVALLEEGAGAQLPVGDPQRTALVNALVDKDRWQEAWSFYRSFRPGADRRRSRDPDFSQSVDIAATFDWIASTGSGLSVSIGNGAAEFSAAPSTSGPLLRQTQMLPPGEYLVQGRSSGIEQADASLPYWALSCRDGRELGRVTVPSSARAQGAFSGRFEVPADCPVQVLSLTARASDKITGLTGQIERVQLSPAG